jgi:hypothetical protein
MFVRVKRISGREYAYLVRNAWTGQGPRQKVAGYAGRVHRPVDAGTARVPLSPADFPGLVRQLCRRELLAHGFTGQDGFLRQDAVAVDLAAGSIRAGRGPCTVAMQEGFLCDATLARLLALKPEGHEERDMHALVAALLEAGLKAAGGELAILYAAWRQQKV